MGSSWNLEELGSSLNFTTMKLFSKVTEIIHKHMIPFKQYLLGIYAIGYTKKYRLLNWQDYFVYIRKSYIKLIPIHNSGWYLGVKLYSHRIQSNNDGSKEISIGIALYLKNNTWSIK